MDLLQPYIKNDGVLVCPSSSRNAAAPTDQVRTYGGRLNSYALNNVYYNVPDLGSIFEKTNGRTPATLAVIEDSAGTVFCADGGDVDGATGSAGILQVVNVSNSLKVDLILEPKRVTSSQGDWIARHNGGLNVAFFDGHSKWLSAGEFTKKNAAGNYPYWTKILD
jgi:prepilin-type processing-associated H-X9-DG protein